MILTYKSVYSFHYKYYHPYKISHHKTMANYFHIMVSYTGLVYLFKCYIKINKLYCIIVINNCKLSWILVGFAIYIMNSSVNKSNIEI